MEQVLCIPRNRLPGAWVSRRSVVPMTLDQFIRQGDLSGFSFKARNLAEEDPDHKQVIPYILLQTRDGQDTAAYRRKGSEKRLHDLWSVGIGGHVNPVDQEDEQTDFKEIILAGMSRELDEELVKRPALDPVEFLGIISEDITPVGSVHLGAVFRIMTNAPEKYMAGAELNRFQWLKTCDLGALNLELWSELALELTGQI